MFICVVMENNVEIQVVLILLKMILKNVQKNVVVIKIK